MYGVDLNQHIYVLQALLERFEFFPVKCRVQRALEASQIELKENASSSLPVKFKTKASSPFKIKKNMMSIRYSSVYISFC